MNMNKKNIILLLIILLCFFSFTVVDASVVDNNLLLATHEYVGENICAEDSIQRVLKLVGYIIIVVKILIPLIIIVMGTVDLFQAVLGKDEKSLIKALKSIGLRLVLGIFIFFVPTIVNWVFDLYYETAGGTNNKQCITCVLDPNDC